MCLESHFIQPAYEDGTDRVFRNVGIYNSDAGVMKCDWSHTSYHLPMKMEQIECSETSAYIIQTSGNYPKENTMYSEHGESLKSRLEFASYFLWLKF